MRCGVHTVGPPSSLLLTARDSRSQMDAVVSRTSPRVTFDGLPIRKPFLSPHFSFTVICFTYK